MNFPINIQTPTHGRRSFLATLAAAVPTFTGVAAFAKNSDTPPRASAKDLKPVKDIVAFKQEFARAWKRSEDYTLTVFEQMPEEKLLYKYTPESFTFAFQFIHCIIFSANHVAVRLGVPNPYEKRKRDAWDNISKADLSKELHEFYAWVRKVVNEAPPKTLLEEEKFAGDTIPKWQLLLGLENHIIHHRGQAIVYLRLNGVTPEGYVGW
ncbi:MAG: DinB family protein [Ignavibacteria bacterium]|nr:DinB family protein [Ignavibacteria bacterium]